jgi:hypothetical protein
LVFTRHFTGELVRASVVDPWFIYDNTESYGRDPDHDDSVDGPHKAARAMGLGYESCYDMWPEKDNAEPVDGEVAAMLWGEVTDLPLVVLAGLR